MTFKREGKPDFNLPRAILWLTFFSLLIPAAGFIWWVFVQTYKISQVPAEFADLKAIVEKQGENEQEHSNIEKAILSVQQSQGAKIDSYGIKLDALADAMGIPVGRNIMLATNSVQAYKPNKNGNDSQP